MMTRLALTGCLLFLLGLTGCRNTGALGGTEWTVMEVLATGESDVADLDVSFGTDGWVNTTVTRENGTVEQTRQPYEVHEDRLLVIKRPEGHMFVLLRMEDDDLFLTGESFQARMAPLN